MREVRKILVDKIIFKWSYGCINHALRNLSMGIGKIPIHEDN